MNGPQDIVRYHLGGNVIVRLRAADAVATWPVDGSEYLRLGRIAFGLLGFADVPVVEVVEDPDAVRVEYADGTMETLHDHTDAEDEG